MLLSGFFIALFTQSLLCKASDTIETIDVVYTKIPGVNTTFYQRSSDNNYKLISYTDDTFTGTKIYKIPAITTTTSLNYQYQLCTDSSHGGYEGIGKCETAQEITNNKRYLYIRCSYQGEGYITINMPDIDICDRIFVPKTKGSVYKVSEIVGLGNSISLIIFGKNPDGSWSNGPLISMEFVEKVVVTTNQNTAVLPNTYNYYTFVIAEFRNSSNGISPSLLKGKGENSRTTWYPEGSGLYKVMDSSFFSPNSVIHLVKGGGTGTHTANFWIYKLNLPQ